MVVAVTPSAELANTNGAMGVTAGQQFLSSSAVTSKDFSSVVADNTRDEGKSGGHVAESLYIECCEVGDEFGGDDVVSSLSYICFGLG